jgi:hypothetical protein
MSGGSFEYMYIKDVEDLINRNDLLERMRDALIEFGAEDAARETEEFRLFLRQIEARTDVYMKRLGPVWHAVEWKVSCDWGMDQLLQKIHEYRGSPPCEHDWDEWKWPNTPHQRRYCKRCGKVEKREKPDDQEEV